MARSTASSEQPAPRPRIVREGTAEMSASRIPRRGKITVGCILFTCLSGKDPRQNPFRELPRPRTVSAETPGSEVSLDDANWIKEQVWSYYETRPD